MRPAAKPSDQMVLVLVPVVSDSPAGAGSLPVEAPSIPHAQRSASELADLRSSRLTPSHRGHCE